jgi:hypothetical protein
MAHARDRGTVTPRIILDMRKTFWVRCLTCQHDAAVDIVALIARGLGGASNIKFQISMQRVR